jgi:hypothetical protein
MGKWAIVQCSCPNREPLEHSRWGVYACGHEDGAIVAFAPGDLVGYEQDFDRIYKDDAAMFQMWRRIGDWRNYDDEYLNLSPDEAAVWQLEIEQLQRFLSGEEFMGWNEMQLWNRLREEEGHRYKRGGYEPSSVQEVISQGLALCRASAELGKPIKFFW